MSKLSLEEFKAMFVGVRNDHPGRKATPPIGLKSVVLSRRTDHRMKNRKLPGEYQPAGTFGQKKWHGLW